MQLYESSFPVYRKYKGIPVWFKLIDDRHFMEIKQVGSRFVSHSVRAEQYPEMLFIQDMIACQDDRWEVVDESAFKQVEAKLNQEK